MVALDATLLMLMLRPNSGRPLDSNGQPISQVAERIAHLVQNLEKSRDRIIVPTPALSEVLVRAGGAGPQIIDTLNRSSVFRIVPFDTLAAIEAAQMTRAAIESGDKRGGLDSTWAKIKFDRQIVAIAKVARARVIYSDDADVRTIAAILDIKVIGTAELPLPPQNPQIEMPLDSPTARTEPGSTSPVEAADETEGDDADEEASPAEAETTDRVERETAADESGDEDPAPDGSKIG